jgi:hypothetical protein
MNLSAFLDRASAQETKFPFCVITAKKNNFNVDQMQFIETIPYDKIYNKLCKFILGIKKMFKQLFSLI